MKIEKETRKLDIEELERRAAPMVIVDAEQEEQPTEPTGSDDPSMPSSGGDGGGIAPETPDQPGNSDGRRSKIWHKSQ